MSKHGSLLWRAEWFAVCSSRGGREIQVPELTNYGELRPCPLPGWFRKTRSERPSSSNSALRTAPGRAHAQPARATAPKCLLMARVERTSKRVCRRTESARVAREFPRKAELRAQHATVAGSSTCGESRDANELERLPMKLKWIRRSGPRQFSLLALFFRRKLSGVLETGALQKQAFRLAVRRHCR